MSTGKIGCNKNLWEYMDLWLETRSATLSETKPDLRLCPRLDWIRNSALDWTGSATLAKTGLDPQLWPRLDWIRNSGQDWTESTTLA